MSEATGDHHFPNDATASALASSADVSAAAVDAPSMSKSARKRVLKQQRQEARKVERKAAEKERRRQDLERRRQEWEEKLAGASEEERARLVEYRKDLRRERMEKRTEERGKRAERMRRAAEAGQKILIDLEFSDLMSSSEIQSLAHQAHSLSLSYGFLSQQLKDRQFEKQVMHLSYGLIHGIAIYRAPAIYFGHANRMNGKCESPAHLWLTGCLSEIGTQLQRLSGYDKWIIEKENRSYIEAFQDQKENLVYLTADAENILEELDANRIYIIGGLVDRNRWKGITMKKAKEQGIQSARLPIGDYIKLASSQVLTVNQVVEILLKFLETRDWKNAFFHVIPQRKRGAVEAKDDYTIDISRIERECKEAYIEEGLDAIDEVGEEVGEEDNDGGNVKTKKQRFGVETEEELT